MIFNKLYLINLTFIAISVWVMTAATEFDLVKLNSLCQELLSNSAKFDDLYMEDGKLKDPNSRDNEKYDKPIKTAMDNIILLVHETWLDALAKLLTTRERRIIVVHNALDALLEFTKTDSLMKNTVPNYYTEDEAELNEPIPTEDIIPSFCNFASTDPQYKDSLKRLFDISQKIKETESPKSKETELSKSKETELPKCKEV